MKVFHFRFKNSNNTLCGLVWFPQRDRFYIKNHKVIVITKTGINKIYNDDIKNKIKYCKNCNDILKPQIIINILNTEMSKT